jgi:hypothetical protein
MGTPTRRIIAVLAGVLAATALATAGGTAHASAGQAFHYKLRGDMAQAIWDNGKTVTFVDAENDNQFGTVLFFDRFTASFDRHGNFTGGTDLSGIAEGSRVKMALDKHLHSATAFARVRVERCHVKPNGNTNHCVNAGTIRVGLTFTGVGKTGHGETSDHFHQDGVTINDHLIGVQRNATVAGTIGGKRVRARELAAAVIAHVKGGGLFVCHGCS